VNFYSGVAAVTLLPCWLVANVVPMPATFEEAFGRVKQLVADFRANEKFYLSSAYQEQEARRDFIDKFWLALGWDVNHETQKNPFEQEVKVERKEHGFSQRRADYAFYLAPNFRDVKFYVEAKKPHGDIATADNYFQTVRYGWSGKTKIAVLHDFEQLEIVDCRFEPKIKTVLSQNIRKFHFHDYEDEGKFAEIYWLFSREAVANSSLEKFAATLPKKRAKDVQPGDIDERFLNDLDEFRDELARAFKNANPNLDGETLTELTQRTLDRLVFLRFLEDKHIEPQNHIAYFGGRDGALRRPDAPAGRPNRSAWQDFIAESRRLDGIYNGIVYKKHEILDTPGFKLDDESFSGICERLSHLNSPYDFNAIPIHILGSIYERFLGKVIVTTDKRARLEEKSEVRKAGGVYYTPEYIVRYIVENTVGKLIAGKTPAQIAGMRFADIACGSGSFLLGVYDLLIRHHTAYYNQNPGKAKKGDLMERDDGLHLSLQKKREILLANIHGVDIDPQAVEVAQLSLYLKLLQDETPGSTRSYQMEFHETLLPTLNKNIVCGNSLIGTDILTGQLFASDEEKKLNPMDFEQRFPHIFKTGGSGELRETAMPLDFTFPGVPLHGSFSYKKRKGAKVASPTMPESEGGFDAIVGNPPYVRQESLSEIKSYLESHYESFDGVADLYAYFMERSLRLLKTGGLFSYIVSSSFLRATYGEPLRRYLKKVGTVRRMVDFGGLPVFANAKDTYVCIPLIAKGSTAKPPRIEICKIPSLEIQDLTPYVSENSFSIPAERFSNEAWALKSDAEAAVFEKIMQAGRPLGEYVERKIFYGLKTGLNEAFDITAQQRRDILKQSPASAPLIKPFLGGEDIRRYRIEDDGKLLIVIPCGWTRAEIAKGKKAAGNFSEKLAWEWLKTNHSGIARHLASFEVPLRKRQDQGDFWWELRPCDYYSHLDAPKIIFPDICKGPRFFIDRDGIYLANTAYCLGSDSLYLLGLLNSRLFWFAISNISIPFGIRAGEYRYRLIYQYMEKVPIRPVDLGQPADKARHDRMVALVEQMLAAKKQLAGAQSDKDKDFYTNRCDGLDRQIDALVYDLYALTPAEITIVEGASK
jgi:type I restriction-modification system DNA methylase subunit